MTEYSKILVFIPTYNDQELLPELTKSIVNLPGDYVPLVVDDGSTIPVHADMLTPGSLYVRLPINFGIGAATHVAFDHAIKHGYDIIARVDSDGQHPVSSLPELVSPLLEGVADMTVGLRLNRDDMSGMRAWLAKAIRWYLTRSSSIISKGRTPTDMNTGFIAMTKRAAKKFNSLSLERYPEPQMFLSAQQFGIDMIECNINQNQRTYGQSSINILKAIVMLYRFHMLLLARILQKSSVK
jgi:glycosyltransferase involved in cell wall biosynthesis